MSSPPRRRLLPGGLAGLDFWEATPQRAPNNYWYRFVVTDGSDTDYYADNTRLDGGLEHDDDASTRVPTVVPARALGGSVPLPDLPRPLPQRRRTTTRSPTPATTTPSSAAGTPEGYCRNYADAATNCPGLRHHPTRRSPTRRPARRDYWAATWVDQQLDYLTRHGLYLNPTSTRSNHLRHAGLHRSTRTCTQDGEPREARSRPTSTLFNHIRRTALSSTLPHYQRGCESRSLPCSRSGGGGRPVRRAPGQHRFYTLVRLRHIPSARTQRFKLLRPPTHRALARQGLTLAARLSAPSFPNGYWDVPTTSRATGPLISEPGRRTRLSDLAATGSTRPELPLRRHRPAPRPSIEGFADRPITPSSPTGSLSADYPDAAYYSENLSTATHSASLDLPRRPLREQNAQSRPQQGPSLCSSRPGPTLLRDERRHRDDDPDDRRTSWHLATPDSLPPKLPLSPNPCPTATSPLHDARPSHGRGTTRVVSTGGQADRVSALPPTHVLSPARGGAGTGGSSH